MACVLVGMLEAWIVAPAGAQTAPREVRPRAVAAPESPRRLPAAVQPSASLPPPPFRLTAEQQAMVDQVLQQWERESAKIRTFRCAFERLEYDPVFLQGGERVPVTISTGQVRYAKPDKGMFRIREIRRYDAAKGSWEASDEAGEHWVCDGEAVYEFSAAKKQLIVRPLPAEMRGKAIADGPLPFLFGAEADRLKQRYFIRITDLSPQEIWLEAMPRFQQDAANFQRVELILERERFLPWAIQVYQPNGKNRTVYKFQTAQAKINDPLERVLSGFTQPRTPVGWQRVVEPAAEREATGGPRQRVGTSRR